MRCLVLRSLIFSLMIIPLTQVGFADALEVTLSEGDVVEFDIAQGPKGEQAANVRKV